MLSKVDEINAGLDDGQIDFIVPPPVDEFGVEMVENVVDVLMNVMSSSLAKIIFVRLENLD